MNNKDKPWAGLKITEKKRGIAVVEVISVHNAPKELIELAQTAHRLFCAFLMENPPKGLLVGKDERGGDER